MSRRDFGRALVVGIAAALGGAMTLVGQTPAQRPSRESLQRELSERRQSHVQRVAEADRLLDVLMRYNLGIAVDGDQYWTIAPEESVVPRADAEAALTEAQRQVAARTARLRQLERSQEDAPGPARSAPEHQPVWGPSLSGGHVEVAQPATTAPPAAPPGASSAMSPAAKEHHGSHAQGPGHQATGSKAMPLPPDVAASARAADEAADRPAPAGGTPELVRGIDDPARIGMALYRAGAYTEAVEHLTKATAGDTPSPGSLFYLALSHEKIGDYGRADGLLIRLEELDTRQTETGEAVLGPWALAARAARQHMTWVRDEGEWQPVWPDVGASDNQ
ncbi:MAG: hypothetical protein AAF628_02855 [Planctomycetota bacterium]